jgi:hypothetical protein
MTKLHQIWVAATVYKQDEGGYPPRLLGFVEQDPQGNVVPADRIQNGFLYPEDIKDINTFKCPDNLTTDKTAVVTAVAPAPPASWPGNGWNSEMMGTYYEWDSYDIGPRFNPDGSVAMDNSGNVIYDIHYSLDWTGPASTGATDMPNQLKYAYPPDDHTMLTYCTWHVATAHANAVTAINMGGTAKKIPLMQMLQLGPNVFNQ